jgi:hypothetical protein
MVEENLRTNLFLFEVDSLLTSEGVSQRRADKPAKQAC